MPVDVKQITGVARSISELLMKNRFSLRFFQREYSWGEAQVGELIDDLASRFLDEFDPTHERHNTASYRPYFLGPIVTEHQDGIYYLADGQQRITTLSLLLIHLQRCLAEKYPIDGNELQGLIFSYIYGVEKFNIDVEERATCMSAIINGSEFDAQSTGDTSVRNLWNRYRTIEERFPDELQGDLLPYFVDWLKSRVILVEIVAPDQDMALEIFETMNDRGLRLSNTDMLKGFLLARVGEENLIRDLDRHWKRRVTELTDIEENASTDFIKAWLRGKYAETKRERKANASPGDFDIIHTAFHKWVRDNANRINIVAEPDFQRFVEVEFLKLSSRYMELLRASKEFRRELASVFHIAQTGFTLQLLVIMAAVKFDDDDTTFLEKANLVANALDIYVVRRMVNYRNFGYNTVVHAMFNLVKEIRNRSIEEIRERLTTWLELEDERLDGIRTFQLTKRNRRHVFYLLARITAWLDEELNASMTFCDYADQSREDPFEVEHVWADKYERHTQEFEHESEFEIHRNRFGDLLLLPKSFNASYGDMQFCDKVQHYFSQNPLAKSLYPKAYENNPGFRKLIETHNLKFVAYPETFTKADIVDRQELYKSLAEIVWDPRSVGLTN